MLFKQVLVVVAVLSASSLADVPAGGQTLTTNVVGTTPTSESITYSCTFRDNWTAANHPAQFPGNAAHWSPPVMAAHGASYSMWEIGSTASAGVEQVAETGATSVLVSELNAAGIPEAYQSVFNSAIFGAGASVVMPDITMDSTYPLLSAVSMIAPSPDWFSGIRNVSPMTGGMWWSNFDIITFPMDAGTEQGDTYSGNNPAENPIQAITEIDENSAPSTGVFINSAGDDVIYVARFTCVQQEANVEEPEDEDDEDEDAGFLGGLLDALFFCF